MTTRTTREIEDREHEVRAEDSDWRPPELLPEPTPEDGFGFRWIRMSLNGELDMRNMGMRRQEGWVIVLPEEQPDLCCMANATSLEQGMIEVGGLVLAKMPLAKARQRDAYYQKKAVDQTDSLARQLNNDAGADPRMPLIQERSSKQSKSPV